MHQLVDELNSCPVGAPVLIKTITFRDRNSKVNTDVIHGLWTRFRLLDEEALEMYGHVTSGLVLNDTYLDDKYELFYTSVLRPLFYRFMVMKNGCIQFYSSVTTDPLVMIQKRGDLFLVAEAELTPQLASGIAAELTALYGDVKCYLCYLFEYQDI